MTMKHWVEAALHCLEECLGSVPHEVNELDWKARLSEHRDRLAEHLMAFSNHPNGGCLVFGVADGGQLEGVDQSSVAQLANTLANLGRDAVEPPWRSTMPWSSSAVRRCCSFICLSRR